MERVLLVATGVAGLEDAVPPALARGWTARPARQELLDVLSAEAGAVEFRRADVPFSLVAVEDRRFPAVTVLGRDETGEAVEPRRFAGAAFQRACCLGYPAVIELLEVLRLPRGRWIPPARAARAEAVLTG